ncbi:katanin p80 WD40 repeat-containing subunit B1 homolog KTN80.1-like isoform X2 [Hibiscus syriacus]|nr:katanin p80 WD40 repeat-containing subunit B1 homolog KTN80.1-like isoform X2 [Hibiscus syriacus]
MDTNLKIWDIRKKGCTHTYKGHTRGISTIRFTPDGRWVVSGGFDNVVKVWDLTAGKLLNEFKFHEGHISSLDFHPLEFLLATGSADGTVKFWDLETFELIGSSRPEAAGVRLNTFHTDGKTLFCGSDDGLKVYSWEPVVCHDSADIGWSTLGDLCINEGKLLGCSYYRNTIGVWGADIAHIEPYGRNDRSEKKFNLEGSYSLEKAGSGMRSTLGSRPLSPDFETKEIKNIYVDTAGSSMIAAPKDGSLNSTKVVSPSDAGETSNLAAERQSPGIGVNAKSNGQSGNNPVVKETTNSGKESITFSRTKPGMLLRPAHVRRPSVNKFEVEKLSAAVESERLDRAVDLNSRTRLVSEDGYRTSCGEKDSNIETVTEKSKEIQSPQTHSTQEARNESLDLNKNSNVKFVNGVAVVRGRTRSLVERFERRDLLNSSDNPVTDGIPPAAPEADKIPSIMKGGTKISKTEPISANDTSPVESLISTTESASGSEGGITGSSIPRTETTTTSDQKGGTQISKSSANDITPIESLISTTESASGSEGGITGSSIPRRETTPTSDRIITGDRISRRESTFTSDRMNARNQSSRKESTFASNRIVTVNQISRRQSNSASSGSITGNLISRRESTSASDGILTKNRITQSESTSISDGIVSRNQLTRNDMSRPTGLVTENKISRVGMNSGNDGNVTIIENQISKGESISDNDGKLTESLMQMHDVFLSTLRSRLTKLQVVRHFWEKNDIKGSISALRKLPDHSVQADVIGVLMEKMEIITLDLFSILLPVLIGLLDSKMERHVNVSLEMLLKLVAVFGPMIRSTVSAPHGVGVDLHAEQRRECCNQCSTQLQKIQKLLPPLARRGGTVGRGAQELNLVLQE